MLDPAIGCARNHPMRLDGSGPPETKGLQMGSGLMSDTARKVEKRGPRLSQPQSQALCSPPHLPRPHVHALGVSEYKAVHLPKEKCPLPTPCSTTPESFLLSSFLIPGHSCHLSHCPSAWYYSGLQRLDFQGRVWTSGVPQVHGAEYKLIIEH